MVNTVGEAEAPQSTKLCGRSDPPPIMRSSVSVSEVMAYAHRYHGSCISCEGEELRGGVARHSNPIHRWFWWSDYDRLVALESSYDSGASSLSDQNDE